MVEPPPKTRPLPLFAWEKEQRTQRQRMALVRHMWLRRLAHVMVSRQETARQLLTPGEVMQLSPDEEIVLVSGLAPIRARKLRYFRDRNFAARVAPAPKLAQGRYADCPKPRGDDWSDRVRGIDVRLHQADDAAGGEDDGGMQQQRHPGLPEQPAKSADAAETRDPQAMAMCPDSGRRFPATSANRFSIASSSLRPPSTRATSNASR